MNELIITATQAARQAGHLIKQNFGSDLTVNEMKTHDIKLEMDVRSQTLIFESILNRHPDHRILGEEGDANQGGDGDYEWIVDPIDGTVNYFFGIPHFCVSIAVRLRESGKMMAGVIYDPMMDEIWTVSEGELPLMNGKPIRVSDRATMGEAVMTVGFSKSKESLDAGFARYKRIAYDVRKTRMLGSAALALAYIACGRLDAYIEEQISLWDIAAGQMLVEAAGGRVLTGPGPGREGSLSICAWNGKIPVEDYL